MAASVRPRCSHQAKNRLQARAYARPVFLLQLLYPGRNIERPDDREPESALLAPGEEPITRAGVGPARVVIVDVGGEELDIAPAGLVAEIGDERRHYIGVGRGNERA